MGVAHGSMLLIYALVAIAALILLITRFKVYPFLVLIHRHADGEAEQQRNDDQDEKRINLEARDQQDQRGNRDERVNQQHAAVGHSHEAPLQVVVRSPFALCGDGCAQQRPTRDKSRPSPGRGL